MDEQQKEGTYKSLVYSAHEVSYQDFDGSKVCQFITIKSGDMRDIPSFLFSLPVENNIRYALKTKNITNIFKNIDELRAFASGARWVFRTLT